MSSSSRGVIRRNSLNLANQNTEMDEFYKKSLLPQEEVIDEEKTIKYPIMTPDGLGSNIQHQHVRIAPLYVTQRSTLFKVTMLISISVLAFGSYFAYDAISSLQSYIQKALDLDDFKFGLLTSVYTFPNIVLLLLNGWIIDKIGNRVSGMIFSILIVLGTFIIVLSAYMRSFYVMLFGRFVFGLGAESSYVVQNNMCVEWFVGRYLAVSMGVSISVSRLGSVLAFSAEGSIANWTGDYRISLWNAFALCCVSFLSMVLYWFMDKHAKRDQAAGDLPVVEIPPAPAGKCAHFRHVLPLQYWLWLFIAVTIYSTIFPFLGLSSENLAKKFKVEPATANYYLSMIDITSLVMCPIFGWVVDTTGKRGVLVIVGNSLAVIAYLMLAFTDLFPLVSIVLLGLHFSLMPAALWPCIPFLVEPKSEGRAFAIVSSLINASLTAVSPLGGLIIDKAGYEMFCLFLAGISALSVIAALIWNLVDAFRTYPVLNRKTM